MGSLFSLLLAAAVAVLFIWVVVLTLQLRALHTFFQKFTEGIDKKDLKTALETIQMYLNKQQQTLKTLDKDFDELAKTQKKAMQTFSLLRYNPFEETGGNQSFVVSLLNAEGDGIVLTSLHSRELTRIYAKEVHAGTFEKSTYAKEEQEAISQALKKGRSS